MIPYLLCNTYRRRTSWILLSVAALLLATAPPGLAQEALPRFDPDACPFITDNPIRCGWLIVPENHDAPEGRVIRLAVAILESSSREPKPDPFVILSGGPGGGLVEFAPLQRRFLTSFLADRAVILIDQRGSGLSQPSLACPEFENQIFKQAQLSEAEKAQPLIDCRARLVAEGIDLSAYNTVQNAADIAALRTALSYEQVNLSGGSYGTRLALTVMRDHPEGIRSVILDSTLPFEENAFLSVPANFDAALTRLEQGCAADVFCRTFYPDVRGTYYTLFERLKEQPIAFQAEHPVNGEILDIVVDGHMLSNLVFNLLYSRERIQMLPGVLYAALDGSYEPLKEAMEPGVQVSSSLSYGMFFSVMCAEDAAALTSERFEAILKQYPEALAGRTSIFGESGMQACALWDVPQLPALSTPIVSPIPTLILAGEYDPITPPAWGKLAAAALPNARFYEFPGVGHGVASHPCPLNMAVEFVDNPDKPLDTGCIESMRGLQFTVVVERTRSLAQVVATALVGAALFSLATALNAFRRHPRQMAVGVTLRMVGWLPLLAAAGILAIFLLSATQPGSLPWSERARVIETFIPLILAVQAAIQFSQDDEPALEILLACPRGISWLLLERVGLVLLAQSGIALLGAAFTLAITPDQDFFLTLLRWLPPSLFLTGIAVYATLKSRAAAFGAVVAGLCWFAFAFFGSSFLPGQPILWPLNYIQPFLWPFHPYLQPGDLSAGDYWLNRLVVAAAGIGLLALAVAQLRDEEQVLSGKKALRKQTKG